MDKKLQIEIKVKILCSVIEKTHYDNIHDEKDIQDMLKTTNDIFDQFIIKEGSVCSLHAGAITINNNGDIYMINFSGEGKDKSAVHDKLLCLKNPAAQCNINCVSILSPEVTYQDNTIEFCNGNTLSCRKENFKDTRYD